MGGNMQYIGEELKPRHRTATNIRKQLEPLGFKYIQNNERKGLNKGVYFMDYDVRYGISWVGAYDFLRKNGEIEKIMEKYGMDQATFCNAPVLTPLFISRKMACDLLSISETTLKKIKQLKPVYLAAGSLRYRTTDIEIWAAGLQNVE